MAREIYFDAPDIGAKEKEYLAKAVDTGYVSTAGHFVKEFEDKIAGYVGSPGAVATQSGTSAIHIALHELGIGRGDEVIVPALTFVATVNPVVYVGATPVLAGVDIETWNIAPDQIERNISDRTKAIIPVHLYGNPCDMTTILEIAGKHDLYVVEDATESLGATYGRRHTGTFGHLGCFSFNGNKTITTGGGGMVVGRDNAKLAHIRFLVHQAKDESREYYHPEIGFNYRMTNIEAALGLAQFERLDTFLAKKKSFYDIYVEELGDNRNIRFQQEYQGASSSRWLSCVILGDGIDPAAVQAQLRSRGIRTRRTFMPVGESPPYKAYERGEYNNARYIHDRGLCLPSSTLNSEEDIRFVCKELKELLA